MAKDLQLKRTYLGSAGKRSTSLRVQAMHILTAQPFLPICFATYMAVRIAVLFVRPLEQSADFNWYYQRAVEIISGAGYAQNGTLTAFWPVGWPGFLAALFTITGPSVLAGQIANLAFAAAVFWLTEVFGRLAFRNPFVGRIAVLALTLYPNQIGYVSSLSTEVFYQAVILSAVLLLMHRKFFTAFLAGLLFSLATLTKTQSLFMPACVLLCVLLVAPSRPAMWRLIRGGAVVYVTIILVVAPWTYRNYLVFHALVPVSTNGGWTMLTGNNPEAWGDYTPDTALAEGINHDPADQVAMDRLAHARAVDWIEKNPTAFLALMPRKIWRLWMPDGESEWFYQYGFIHYDQYVVWFRSLRVINQAYYFALMASALPAVWLMLRRRAAVFLEISPWAITGLSLCIYATLISIVFSGQSRFHFSLMPFVITYGAWTWTRILQSGTDIADWENQKTKG